MTRGKRTNTGPAEKSTGQRDRGQPGAPGRSAVRHPQGTPLGSRSRRASPELVGELLARTLVAPALREKAEAYAAFPLWPEIAGPAVADVAKPVRIVGGNILMVQVIDSTWAQELSLQKEELLQKIRRRNVGAVIEDIKFVTGNPKRFSPR